MCYHFSNIVWPVPLIIVITINMLQSTIPIATQTTLPMNIRNDGDKETVNNNFKLCGSQVKLTDNGDVLFLNYLILMYVNEYIHA